MEARLTLTNLFEECIISHYYVKNGVVITLQLIDSGNHLADISYCPQNMNSQIRLINKSEAACVLQRFDIAISWMKAYYAALENTSLEAFPADRMAQA